MKKDLKQGVEFSHWLFKEHVSEGSKVIDATVGNGNDTEFLAHLVGENGQVWGFDIQFKAIQKAEKKINKAGLKDRVNLIQDGHENLNNYVEEPIDGILFNLGYLPGGDKGIITHPETTLQAIKKGLKLLTVGGIIVLVVYLGHSGGKKEQQIIFNYIKDLDENIYNVLQYRFINQEKEPPQVFAVKKRRR